MQTLQQQRAKHALEKVQKLEKHPDTKKFKARAGELPFMIRAAGLGQAAAFFKSKGNKDGYGEIFEMLQSWLTTEQRPYAKQADLLSAITKGDMHTYRLAQAEAMQYMHWVKTCGNAYWKE